MARRDRRHITYNVLTPCVPWSPEVAYGSSMGPWEGVKRGRGRGGDRRFGGVKEEGCVRFEVTKWHIDNVIKGVGRRVKWTGGWN